MMTANEARQKQKERILSYDSPILDDIENQIRKAIDENEEDIYCLKYSSKRKLKHIEKLKLLYCGYVIIEEGMDLTVDDDQSLIKTKKQVEYKYTISWSDSNDINIFKNLRDENIYETDLRSTGNPPPYDYYPSSISHDSKDDRSTGVTNYDIYGGIRK